MSEATKAAVRRWWDEGLNKHNLNLADELMDPEYVLHDPTLGDVKGPENFKQFVAGFFRAFPDAHCAVEAVTAAGDEFTVRWTFGGTHQGEFMGIAPTGRQIAGIGAVAMGRVRDGKHVEAWQVVDFLTLMRQLGAAPEPVETNKALVRRYLDTLLNGHDWAVMYDILAEHFVFHAPSLPEVRTAEALRQLHLALNAGFPDLHFTLLDLTAEGDRVSFRWEASGTHEGEYLGAAPTGRFLRWGGIDTVRIAGGRIVEEWCEIDSFGFFRQLGGVPQVG